MKSITFQQVDRPSFHPFQEIFKNAFNIGKFFFLKCGNVLTKKIKNCF